jgi:hypothetical protein
MQFLYLAKRDKKNILVLGAMNNNSAFSEKKLITDVTKELQNLTDEFKFKISSYAYQNRMHYDLFIQDFANYFAFKSYLTRNGYTGVPSGLQPLFFNQNKPLLQLERPIINSMIQRNSKKT